MHGGRLIEVSTAVLAVRPPLRSQHRDERSGKFRGIVATN
jgi:hypothetical protein